MKNLWNQALTNEELAAKFKATLKEYLQTLDVNYVGEYLRELSCHYYLHEFVRRLVILAVENTEDPITVQEALIKLLHGLNHQYDLPKRQIDFGLKKAEKYIHDSLKVDVPHAPELFEALKLKLVKVKFVSDDEWFSYNS